MATVSTEPQPLTQPSAPAPRDFRQEVTDRIISMLERGVAPWQKPWNPAEASAAMPRIESIQIVRSIIKPLRRKVCRRVRVKPHRKFVKCFINN